MLISIAESDDERDKTYESPKIKHIGRFSVNIKQLSGSLILPLEQIIAHLLANLDAVAHVIAELLGTTATIFQNTRVPVDTAMQQNVCGPKALKDMFQLCPGSSARIVGCVLAHGDFRKIAVDHPVGSPVECGHGEAVLFVRKYRRLCFAASHD